MPARVALIAGASGLVGGFCLRFLLEDPAYRRVVSVGRRRVPIEDPKLHQETVDFYRLDAFASALPCDDVFCCLGTTIRKAGSREAFRKIDFDAALYLARLARQAGARRFFLVSSSGADSRSPIFYSRVKGEIEAAVSALGFAAVFLLRPSLLLGERGEPRLKEKLGELVLGALKPALVGPLRKYRAIEASVVARAMLRLAATSDGGVKVLESDELEALGRG